MLTVISPAKTLDYETPIKIKKHTQPLFADRSAELIDILAEYSPKRLGKLMGISDKLAELNVNRYAEWTRKSTTKNARQSLLAFKGDVYVGMNAQTFKESEFAFAQDHLRILSGLYGALRPLDLMQPYRLEMDDVLLNLASNEYFKSVKVGLLEAKVVAPVFKDQKNGKYKIISFFAKKARGAMSGWVIRKNITDPKKLKKFTELGYRYSADESTEKSPVFLRDEA